MSRNPIAGGVLSALVVLSASVYAIAAGAPKPVPTEKRPFFETYPMAPNGCYAQLKSRWPFVLGGRHPVCDAIVANLNRFCDEPPRYTDRKLHPLSRDLSAPDWVPLDPSADLALFKAVFLAGMPYLNREDFWRADEARLMALLRTNRIELYRADIDVDAVDGLETVYMLKNLYPEPKNTAVRSGNAPRYMFTELGSRAAPLKYTTIFTTYPGDLWKFGRDWYLLSYDAYQRATQVHLFSNPAPGVPSTPGYITDCMIQHVSDR